MVISGEVEGVEEAMVLAKEAGAKRAVPLTVSGAFHSPLMEPAKEGLREKLEKINFSDPEFPVVSNVTAEPVSDGSAGQGAAGRTAHFSGALEGIGREDGGDGRGAVLRVGTRLGALRVEQAKCPRDSLHVPGEPSDFDGLGA